MSSMTQSTTVSNSGGYYTVDGRALFSTVSSLPEMLPQPADAIANPPPMSSTELDELVALAAAIITVPSASSSTPPPSDAAVATAPAPAPAAAAAAPVARSRFPLEVTPDDGSIFWHGEVSSSTEPGFQAIICLRDRPLKLVPSLGLPLQESYRHCVFLQRTEGPNQMFGPWCEDEAQDEREAAAAAAANLLHCDRLTLRLRLDDYLDLLALLQQEWGSYESLLMSTARQLAAVDQPVKIAPKVRMRGQGVVRVRRWIGVGRRLRLSAEVDTRSVNNAAAASGGIQMQLEVFSEGGPSKKMTVPLSSLAALVVDCEAFIHDLRQMWKNSLRDSRRRLNREEAATPDFLAQAAVADKDDGRSNSLSVKEKTARQECGNKRKSGSNGNKDPRLYGKHGKRSSSKESTTTTTMTTTTNHRSNGNKRDESHQRHK